MPKKFIFSPASENCEKIFPIFFTFRGGKFLKIALFGKTFSRLAFLGGKFANSGVKIEKNRVKSIKICTFWGKSSPHSYFPSPPPTFIWQNIHL